LITEKLNTKMYQWERIGKPKKERTIKEGNKT
jgi:hypothetical protein